MDFNVKQAIIDRLEATKRDNRIALYNYMSENGFYNRRCHRHHKYEGGLAGGWMHRFPIWRWIGGIPPMRRPGLPEKDCVPCEDGKSYCPDS